MVEAVLTEIENWFQEPSTDANRPKLLSKLAILELCGWLEEWMDDLLREIDQQCLRDSDWLESEVIGKTNGFHYSKHFRPMMCSVLGEHTIREVESDFEAAHQGDFESLRSALGDLWTKRCILAHSNLQPHSAAQASIMGPSWTKNQYRIINRRLGNFRTVLLSKI